MPQGTGAQVLTQPTEKPMVEQINMCTHEGHHTWLQSMEIPHRSKLAKTADSEQDFTRGLYSSWTTLCGKNTCSRTAVLEGLQPKVERYTL